RGRARQGAGVPGQDGADLIGVGLRRGRQALAQQLDVPDGREEAVGLAEERELPGVWALALRRGGVEVVRYVVERDPRLVVRRVEEVLDQGAVLRRRPESEPHELRLRAHAPDPSTMASYLCVYCSAVMWCSKSTSFRTSHIGN